tara:strand:- start:1053 stop:2594 length:1542 start_codon:yes stop_codon:yes gene_type:complete
MKKLIFLLSLLLTLTANSQINILYSNDFESSTTGYVTSTTTSDPLWIYVWAGHSGCATSDGWRVDNSGGYGTNANITGNYASIDYGAQSCNQDISLCTKEFTPTKNQITVSFDWAHRIYLGSELLARLYDNNGAVVETLVVATSTDAGRYEQAIAVTAGTAYSIDFRYTANWEYGSKIDNILVTETAGNYETVQIGNGTASSSLVPAYGYFDYSWSGMIFLQSEIDQLGDLESISWYVDGSSPSSTVMNDQKIYVAHTTSNQFSNTPTENLTNDITVTDYTLVYDGTIDWTSPGWKTITLQQPFAYNNVNNILIKVENRDGSYTTSYPSFDYTTANNKACYNYQDGSYPTDEGTRTNNRPNIKFSFNTGGGVALPIELISFEGELIDEIEPSAMLTWVVASQVNNDYYTLYHSMDGFEWNILEQIPGAGNTNIEMQYTAIHKDVQYGYNYYKLRQTDYDGMLEEFNIISVYRKEPRIEIVKIYSPLGYEISENTKGIHINLWNNGEVTKSFHH